MQSKKRKLALHQLLKTQVDRKLNIKKLVADFNIKVAASPYANCLDNLAMDEIAHYRYLVIISRATYRDKMSFLATALANSVVNSQVLLHTLNCEKPILIVINLLKVKYPINVAGDEREEDDANAQTIENGKVASPDTTDDSVGDHEVCFFDWV